MAEDSQPVRLQLLLKGAALEPARRGTLETLLRSLGLELTAHGTVAATARTDLENFSRLFAVPPDTTAELAVPDCLRDLVRSITVSPPHDYFDPGAPKGR
jgi:hypothetical protein